MIDWVTQNYLEFVVLLEASAGATVALAGGPGAFEDGHVVSVAHLPNDLQVLVMVVNRAGDPPGLATMWHLGEGQIPGFNATALDDLLTPPEIIDRANRAYDLRRAHRLLAESYRRGGGQGVVVIEVSDEEREPLTQYE